MEWKLLKSGQKMSLGPASRYESLFFSIQYDRINHSSTLLCFKIDGQFLIPD